MAERATSCSGWGTGSVRRTSALSRLPTAVVAPIATVSVTMTIKEKVGARRKLRMECRTSRPRTSHMRAGYPFDRGTSHCRLPRAGFAEECDRSAVQQLLESHLRAVRETTGDDRHRASMPRGVPRPARLVTGLPWRDR